MRLQRTFAKMIVSIVHKGLKQLWLKDDSSRLPPEQVDKTRRILEALDRQ